MKTVYYSIIIILALTFFYILRPYRIIDHSSTTIICAKTNVSYTIGPSFIYIFGEVIDPITDKMVRSLCAYGKITVFPSYETIGGWGELFLLLAFILLAGLSFVDMSKRDNQKRFFAAGVASFIVFFFFLRIPVQTVYCKRQIASKFSNFKKSAYGYGMLRIQQEEPIMMPVLQSVYQTCVKQAK